MGGAAIAALLSVNPASAQTTAPASAPEAEVGEVVVTGSRLQNPTYTAPTPVAVMGAKIIEERAKPTIGETLSEMPSFKTSTGLGQGTRGTLGAGQAVLDLRGLGTTRTLVLIDGDRVIPTLGNGTFDTNMLPSQMIERVDVVTGGASAAYGSDAVAGVVNFIMNRRLDGVRADARFGISQQGDAEEYGINFAIGRSFMGDRLHIVAGADLGKGEGTGNQYTRKWGRREADVLPLTPARPAGTPQFVVADGVHSLIPSSSLIVNCFRGAVAVAGCSLNGLTFDNSGAPRPQTFGRLLGGAAMAGGDNYGTSFNGNGPLRQGFERMAGMATLTYDLENDMTASLDLSGGRFQNHSTSFEFGHIQPGNIRVNRDNPFLPAALAAQMDAQGITQIQMSRIASDVGGIKPNNVNKFFRIGAELRGKIFEDWTWDVGVSTGKSRFTYQADDFVIVPNYLSALHAVRAADGSIVCGPLATNPMLGQISAALRPLIESGCTPYNPFGSNPNSAAALDYVSGTSISHDNLQRTSAALNLAGNVFSLPAGEVSVAAGYEFHTDSLDRRVPQSIRALSAAGGFWATNFVEAEGETTVHEGYAEVGVPLLKDLPLAYSLDLNGAIRYADYSTHGGATTWKIGATYEPLEWLRFRGTRSRDIRAPTLADLYVPQPEGLAPVVHPVTGVAATVIGQTVGNPNLQPETASTTSVGFVLQPKSGPLAGLNFSADYFSIEIKDVLTAVTTAEVLRRFYVLNDQSLAPFIITDNSAIGFRKVASPILNLNRQKTTGFDLALNYRIDLSDYDMPGAISISSNASRIFQLETFDSQGRSLGNQAGSLAGVPKWRWTTNLTYEQDRFSGTLTARYNSSIKYRYDLLAPGDTGYNPASPLSINDNVFPDMVYYSLSASYRVREDITVYGVVDNLFDKDPAAGSWNGLQGFYDGVGRYFRVGVRLRR